jgi:hypothetical protein
MYLADFLHIGRLFMYFGQCFENDRSSINFSAPFFHGTGYVLILINNQLGYSMDDLFTNSSGHPDPRQGKEQCFTYGKLHSNDGHLKR